MPRTSVLQFDNYSVEELSFKKAVVPEDQHEFQFNPHFNHELCDCGDNKFDVKLSVEVFPDEAHPMPFSLRVAIVGHFTYLDNNEHDVNFKQQILEKNTVSILFPFLRQIVASLTSNANIPALMLPIMNFHDDQVSE